MKKEIVDKPWGNYIILGESDHMITKIITIFPSHRISLQKHNHRSESWYILEGKGVFELENSIIEVSEGSYLSIPIQSFHRIENSGVLDLKFIEVQSGNYLSEDDIFRKEDDYGRE